MIIFKPGQALITHADWPKLHQNTHFKAFSSQNHAPFKLVQACLQAELFPMGNHKKDLQGSETTFATCGKTIMFMIWQQ